MEITFMLETIRGREVLSKPGTLIQIIMGLFQYCELIAKLTYFLIGKNENIFDPCV